MITYLIPAGGCEDWRCVAEERGNNTTNLSQIINPSFIPVPIPPMVIFNRKSKARFDGEPAPTEKEKVKWSKRPASQSPPLPRLRMVLLTCFCFVTDTAFKQQRLKAWQPILTPKSVLPTLLIIGIIFAPIGALIVWGSGKVTTITLDYTECDVDAPTDGSYQAMPSSAYQCMFYFHNPLDQSNKVNGPIRR